jgi:hypothetical protein
MYKSCPVRITADQIIIYTPDFEQVCVYTLSEKGSLRRYTGLPPEGKRPSGIKLPEVKQRLFSMGEVMKRYVEKLVGQKKDPTTSLTKLLALKVTYSADDILMAVDRAYQHGVYDVRTIESFLKTHARPLHALKNLFDQQSGYED